MGLHTPRVWNQTALQSEPHNRGLSSSRHTPKKLMTVESCYTYLTGASKLCASLVMQYFHLMMHLFHHLVVSLSLVQLLWKGASILVFLRMWSPYLPNLSPIIIYHPPPVLIPPSEFDPLFTFLTIPFFALHTYFML